MSDERLTYPDGRISVAPMMDWTDRHDRYFLRLISRRALLYTEMVTTGALLHGDVARHLDYDAAEHPVALQLGGSEPDAMAECARLAEQWGYDEVNINVGCPSDRVQSGAFGACLMREPETVAACVAAMKNVVGIPVTVKCRIGVDDQPEGPALRTLVAMVRDAGCDGIAVHARKAWLDGLSPKENRDIPPLNYPLVHSISAENPDCFMAINGGIQTLDEAEAHLAHMSGVMIGRAAYQTPWILADVDHRFYGEPDRGLTRFDVVEAMLPYIERRLEEGLWLGHITRHMLGLFQGLPGAKQWRRHLSENAHKPGAGPETVREAADRVREVLDRREAVPA
jgi:tRNA-dihydrouridine synthase A